MFSPFLVEVKDLTIVSNGKTIISEVSFNLKRGEFIFLVGKSGTGKSTIIKTLYAGAKISSGQVIVDGDDVAEAKGNRLVSLRRKLGIILQEVEFFMDKSVIDNLKFYLKITGWKCKKTINSKVEEILDRFKIGYLAKANVYDLSRGEKQKLAIARAFLNDPLILLADEPFGYLDKEEASEIFELFINLNKEGTCIIFATSEVEVSMKDNYRILQCESGRVYDLKK